MTNDDTNIPQPDPLTIGELSSLQDAADIRGYPRIWLWYNDRIARCAHTGRALGVA